MTLNDGLADCQAKTRSSFLGGEERVENSVMVDGLYSGPCILHANDKIIVAHLGPDP